MLVWYAILHACSCLGLVWILFGIVCRSFTSVVLDVEHSRRWSEHFRDLQSAGIQILLNGKTISVSIASAHISPAYAQHHHSISQSHATGCHVYGANVYPMWLTYTEIVPRSAGSNWIQIGPIQEDNNIISYYIKMITCSVTCYSLVYILATILQSHSNGHHTEFTRIPTGI